ncbi:MAG: DEAD/DEAH box helicase, partial [Pseudomonadota bacterium]|nr:DEAD/DEAH box helicase [Pseudomonadota bacterium]
MTAPEDTLAPSLESPAAPAPGEPEQGAVEGTTPTPEGTPEAAVAAVTAPSRRSDYVSDRHFSDFPISSEVLQGLTELGYSMATPVQAMTIDPALAGKDLLVRAKTGTGKTAAFCVPVVERIQAGDRKPRAIMLAPTRELAIQIAQECTGIAKYKDLRIAAIYGGVGFPPQEQALRDGCEIVVGTPGRILDHIKRGNLDLSNISFAVLDEADEMLSMGFLEDVRKILDRTPKSRQNLFVSATINESIKGLIRNYLKDPEEIYLSVDGENVSNIAHVLYETSPDYHKARALIDLIELERPASALIFCNTREDVNTVYSFLDRQGIGVEMISGELAQARREKVMARVKAGAVQYLVATDVAARGIDISDLSHVINYALPEDPNVYMHRCGRTGRIGKTGIALTLAGGADFSTRLSLERQHKIVFDVKHLPTPEESKKLQADRIARALKTASGTMAYEAYIDVVKAIKERPDADMVLAVALRGFFQWDQARRAQAAEALDNEGGAPSEARTEQRDDRGRDGGRDRDRPRDRDRDRPRDDRPRDDRPRDRDRGPRSDARSDSPRGDAPRSDFARSDAPREARVDGPRPARAEGGDAPRELRGDRGDAPRNDSPRGERRPRGERTDAPRGERTDAPRGERTDAPRGERTDAPRGERTDAPAGERGDAPRGERK